MRSVFLLITTLLLSGGLQAADIRIAVAANFRDTLEVLADAYEAQTEDRLLISGGPTGALYNQIVHGAPFDLFLSADTVRPERLEQAELTAPGSLRVYALGQLVLWDPDGVLETVAGLADYSGRLAIASPEVAPYGAAAMEILTHMNLVGEQAPFKMVRGNSIAQAYQYVYTGNAKVGFVAASQVVGKEGTHALDSSLYTPLAQALVQLKRSENPEASAAFVAWLSSPEALEIIQSFGYALPQ